MQSRLLKAGTVVAKEYFLTNQGHQAFAIHYETNLLGNTLSFYSFGIDGTTTGYQGTPGNWLYFPILISNSTLSFQHLDIAKTVEFTEGSKTEFNGLSPGGSSPIAYTPPSGTGLSYANGVLQNQYFTMETGNNWNGIDPVLTDTDILTSASFIHDDFTGSMTVIPLYDTYMSDIMYLDYMLENAESIAEVAGTVVAKEYFLTNQGHQAFAIHYETNLLGNTLSFYSFGIDGTTTGYQEIGFTSPFSYQTQRSAFSKLLISQKQLNSLRVHLLLQNQ